MNALPDYYQILGVPSAAQPEEIVRAFRQQAMRCHPDRGGTDAAMRRLLEAWHVLRNPDSRQAYDEFLEQQGDQSAALSTFVAHARTTADQYPRRWFDFEKWMNGFLDDFTKAEYGWAQSGIFQAPTAKNSVSGKVLIFIGCALGLIIGGAMWTNFKGTPYYSGMRLLVPVGIAIGGTAGMLVHLVLRSGINACRRAPQAKPAQPNTSGNSAPPPIPSSAQEPSREIKFTCPHCGQHIEAPVSLIGSVVTCPTCTQNIHIGKRPGKTQPPPIPGQQKQPPPIP